MIRGSAQFDGIAVGELTVNFLGTTLTFNAKAAFINTKSGQTHGWTQNSVWSPETIAKLKELRACMELDLGKIHLEGGGEVLVAPTGAAPNLQPKDFGGGLGEHLGDD